FFNWAGMGSVDCVKDVFGFYMEAVDVVEPAVPGFGDDGKRPPVFVRAKSLVLDRPANHGVANDTDAVRIGDHDWTDEKTGFFYPGSSGHFAVAILRIPAGKNCVIEISAARQNGGNSGANRAFADLEFPFAGDERSVADKNSCDVGDCVEWSRSAFERN